MSQQVRPLRMAVLLFTDIVGSTELKSRFGTGTYARLISRHDEIFREQIATVPDAELLSDTGDGYFALFPNVTNAVMFALRFQYAVHLEHWDPEPLPVRIGIHVGEIAMLAAPAEGKPRLVGLAADLASRLTALASGNQILLTNLAFNEARQFISAHPPLDGHPVPPLQWVAHGSYLFKGIEAPVEVFEVGAEGIAPLKPPVDKEKAHRNVPHETEATLGWRPAIGLEVPQRPGWFLQRKLGEGTFGEVWLARHDRLKDQRVFKFCFDNERLQSFKRELTFFRLLRDVLGERPDIAKIYDVRLDHPPFFIESQHAPGGNLIDWAESQGGLEKLALTTRLEIFAKVCDAVAAAHSIGILHKDIKPSNILVHVSASGEVQPQLSDFGIGLLTDRGQLVSRQITEVGFTVISSNESSRSGTRIYAPPESMTGSAFTTAGDIYALGVLLFQLVVEDFGRPLALGWERDVEDELIREDIAACVDGDPERRIKSAAEVAERVRRLRLRRAQRDAQRRHHEASLRRHRLLKIAAAAVVLCGVLTAMTVIAYVRERRLRLVAQISEAQTAIAEGIQAHGARHGEESRNAFLRARKKLADLGESTLAAEVGLFRSFHEFDAPINTLTGHDGGVMGVVWLPDGGRVCSAAEDGTVRVWDVRTGRQLAKLEGHGSDVLSLAASPDGRYLLSGARSEAVLWDIEKAAPMRVFKEVGTEVRGVAFSPDGRLALTASKGKSKEPGAVRLWNLSSGQLVRSYYRRPREGTDGYQYYAVAFSPDGRRILATTYERDIAIWDVTSEQLLQQLKNGHAGFVVCAVFLPDGQRVLSGSFDQNLILWNIASAKVIKVFRGHSAAVRGVTLLGPRGESALSCGIDGNLIQWAIEPGENPQSGETIQTGDILRTFAGHVGGIRCIAISPDGQRAVTGGMDRTVRVWDLRKNRDVPSTRPTGDALTSLDASLDGALIAAADWRGQIMLCDSQTLRPLQRFAGHDRPIDCLCLLSDGRRLVSCDDRGITKIWDIVSGQGIPNYPARRPPRVDVSIGSGDWCYSSVDREGRFALSTSNDRRSIDLWSLQSGGAIRTIGPAAADITCIALSSDSSSILTGHADGSIAQWNTANGVCLFTTASSNKSERLDRVAFSSDGSLALAAGHDPIIRLWDLRAQRQVQSFTGHTSTVFALGFGRDPRVIYSAGGDQTLRMWDTLSATQYELNATFMVPTYATLTVVPPGNAVAAASGSIMTVWNVSRSLQHLDFEQRLDAARATLASNPDDAAALTVLGDWYAFRGVHDWAVDLLEQARARGGKIDSFTLARCYWQLDRPAEAVREFRNAAAENPKLEAYLRLCISAVTHPPTTRPTPALTTAQPGNAVR